MMMDVSVSVATHSSCSYSSTPCVAITSVPSAITGLRRPTSAAVADLKSLLDTLEIRETTANRLATTPWAAERLKALGYVE